MLCFAVDYFWLCLLDVCCWQLHSWRGLLFTLYHVCLFIFVRWNFFCNLQVFYFSSDSHLDPRFVFHKVCGRFYVTFCQSISKVCKLNLIAKNMIISKSMHNSVHMMMTTTTDYCLSKYLSWLFIISKLLYQFISFYLDIWSEFFNIFCYLFD